MNLGNEVVLCYDKITSKHNHYIFLSIIYTYPVLTKFFSRKHALVHVCARDRITRQWIAIEAILSVSSIGYRHSQLIAVHGTDLAEWSGNRTPRLPSIGWCQAFGQHELNDNSCSTPHAMQESRDIWKLDTESTCGDRSIFDPVNRMEGRLYPLAGYMRPRVLLITVILSLTFMTQLTDYPTM
jgi:hypothetical protein